MLFWPRFWWMTVSIPMSVSPSCYQIGLRHPIDPQRSLRQQNADTQRRYRQAQKIWAQSVHKQASERERR